MLDARATPLVERDREVAVLDALVADALAGGGRLALIEGLAGIGKSRLLTSARERAAPRMTVLLARASELEREFPFGAVRQLFEHAIAEPGRRERLLSGAAAPARQVFDGVADGGEDGGGSFAALHGLFWLAFNLAEERPLLLAIDDLQWCDRPSLRFLAYLTRRLEGVRILMAATQRSTDPGTDPALLADIAQDPLTVALRPRPLTAGGVRDLVGGRLGETPEPAFADACLEATGGNPLLLRQLLAALAAEGVRPVAASAARVGEIGPRAVSRTVLARTARLPAQARAVAHALAVLGEGAGLAAVARLAGVDESRAAEATGELTRAEILRSESPLGFMHPLVRDALYHELSPAERSLAHARAAELLVQEGASADQVATQLLNAPRRGDEAVCELLLEAGKAARRRGAADNAAAYMRRALEEPPAPERRPVLVFELGLAEMLVSAPPAIEHLQEAYETIGDVERRTRAAHHLARLWCFSDTPERAMHVAREAAAALGPEHRDAARGLEASQHMARFFGAGGLEEYGRVVERYRDGIDDPGVGARMLEAMTAYAWMLECGPAERCVALALRALDGGVLVERDDNFFTMGAMLALIVADREETAAQWEVIQAQAHRTGSLFSALGVHLWSGYTALCRGDLPEAEQLVRQTMHENTLFGAVGRPGTAYVPGILAIVLIERGDLAGAGQVLADAPQPEGTTDGENYMRRARVELALARGDDRVATVAAAVDFAEHGSYVVNPALAPYRSLHALALDRAGRHEEAQALAREEAALARQFGAPRALGRALRALAAIQRDDELALLDEAVAVLAGSPAKLERAKALAALGAALRRDRRPSEARDPLRQALELATICGADPVVQFARAELHATGARPRSDALRGVRSLTPSEARVAGLAAGGETNRAIAESLYVTPKTVEVHLSNVYRKLGIRSRRELPEALVAA